MFRFAKFIEGDCHITKHEMTLHEEDMSEMFEKENCDYSLISEEDESIGCNDPEISVPLPSEAHNAF